MGVDSTGAAADHVARTRVDHAAGPAMREVARSYQRRRSADSQRHVIQESGPTQRIENLQKARGAREIDAHGQSGRCRRSSTRTRCWWRSPVQISRTYGRGERNCRWRVLSRLRLEGGRGRPAAEAWARYGALSVGAHSGCANNLRESVRKFFSIHQGAAVEAAARSLNLFSASERRGGSPRS